MSITGTRGEKENPVSGLVSWGEKNLDSYPWRSPSSAYESAVAEIMLIRTPAEQVLPVYRKFLDKFPDVNSLSESTESEIADFIEPLGLSWRAERLKQMADFVVENYDGVFPDSQDDLEKIPGLGQYGASMVRIFYFEKMAYPIDSNTVRFFERYFGNSYRNESRRDPDLKKDLKNLAPEGDEKGVGFIEALLDFMRKVCTPHNPECNTCQIRSECDFYSKRKEGKA